MLYLQQFFENPGFKNSQQGGALPVLGRLRELCILRAKRKTVELGRLLEFKWSPKFKVEITPAKSVIAADLEKLEFSHLNSASGAPFSYSRNISGRL